MEEANRHHKADVDFRMFPLLTFHLSVSPTDGGPQARCRSAVSDFTSVTKKISGSEVVEFLSAATPEPASLADVDFLKGLCGVFFV